MNIYVVYVTNSDTPFEIYADNFTVTDNHDLFIWDYTHSLQEEKYQKISRAYFPDGTWQYLTSTVLPKNNI